MPRIKITEYRAKKLILGESYPGLQGKLGQKFVLPKSGRFVVKVDQGIKKRFVQGLVALDQPPKAIQKLFAGWTKKGFDQFLVEPHFTHNSKDERYFSLERVREGIRVLFSRSGGIATESHAEDIQRFIVGDIKDVAKVAKATDIPLAFLEHLFSVFEKQYFAFCEINPLVIQDGKVHLLDAAVLVDDAGAFFVSGGWTGEDVVVSKTAYAAEDNTRFS
jgi:succinyl-CoA synthetase beta subunit